MFVKKDLRKIPQILDEAKRKAAEPPSDGGKENSAALTELRLARRPAEFNGSLSVLCKPENISALHHLESLSLYDCQIESLDGIGILGSSVSDDGEGTKKVCPEFRELNVGRNPITTLPTEMSSLTSLRILWCDDCSISGAIPDCVLECANLEVLRMSNNSITGIPARIGDTMQNLKLLCLDGNKIDAVPPGLVKLENLESLMLRQNKIECLPEGVPGQAMKSLTLFHISSNQLKVLPGSLPDCSSLEKIYANGNEIVRIPVGIGEKLTNLRTLNLSSNKLESLPEDFLDRFGEPNVENGICEKDDFCKVHLSQNPVVAKVNGVGGEDNLEAMDESA